MIPEKVYAIVAVVSWAGSLSSATAQVVVSNDTLVPVGVALALIIVLIGAAWKARGWVEKWESRIRAIETLSAELDDKYDKYSDIKDDLDRAK